MRYDDCICISQFLPGDLMLWDERWWFVRGKTPGLGVGRVRLSLSRWIDPDYRKVYNGEPPTYPTQLKLDGYHRRRYYVIRRRAEIVPEVKVRAIRTHSPVGVN